MTSITYSAPILVHTQIVGLLIGKNGAYFRDMAKFSNAKLHLQSYEDMPEGSRERVLIISGSKNEIIAALSKVFERIESRSQSGEEDSQNKQLIKWIIPQSLCGTLIGRGGEGIKKINELSGSWVKVAHSEEFSPGLDERLVYIRGSATQNAAALQIIINKVGGRPFDEEVNPSEPLIKIEETNCVISIPTSAATFIVTGQSFGELPHPDRVYTMGGATVRFSVESMSQQQQEETVLTITGKRSAVQSAKSMLGAKLEEWHQFYGTSSGNGFLAQSAIATLLSSSAPSSARSLYPSDEPWGGEFTETDAIDEDDESNLVLEMCVKVLINMEWADWLVGVSDGNCENILLGINYRTGCALWVAPTAAPVSIDCQVCALCISGSPLGKVFEALDLFLDFIYFANPAAIPSVPVQVKKQNQNALAVKDPRDLATMGMGYISPRLLSPEGHGLSPVSVSVNSPSSQGSASPLMTNMRTHTFSEGTGAGNMARVSPSTTPRGGLSSDHLTYTTHSMPPPSAFPFPSQSRLLLQGSEGGLGQSMQSGLAFGMGVGSGTLLEDQASFSNPYTVALSGSGSTEVGARTTRAQRGRADPSPTFNFSLPLSSISKGQSQLNSHAPPFQSAMRRSKDEGAHQGTTAPAPGQYFRNLSAESDGMHSDSLGMGSPYQSPREREMLSAQQAPPVRSRGLLGQSAVPSPFMSFHTSSSDNLPDDFFQRSKSPTPPPPPAFSGLGLGLGLGDHQSQHSQHNSATDDMESGSQFFPMF